MNLIPIVIACTLIPFAANYIISTPLIQKPRLYLWRWYRYIGHARPFAEVHIKPFDCESCLAFWLSLAYLLYNHVDVFTAIIVALASAFISFKIN